MASLDAMINNYASRLRDAKTLEDVRKFVEKELYKKYGISRRVEKTAYEIADCVADKLKIRR